MLPNFYWVAESIDGVKFDDTAYKLSKGLAVIFDSGTSLTMVPGSIYDQFLEQIINRIPPWVEYQFDEKGVLLFTMCSDVPSFP